MQFSRPSKKAKIVSNTDPTDGKIVYNRKSIKSNGESIVKTAVKSNKSLLSFGADE